MKQKDDIPALSLVLLNRLSSVRKDNKKTNKVSAEKKFAFTKKAITLLICQMTKSFDTVA